MADSFSLVAALADPNVDLRTIPVEGIQFGNFDSSSLGWFLVSRDAPSPSENEIVESIPYRQGKVDFSVYNGDRYFTNRTITYEFMYFGEESVAGADYYDRKAVEQDVKRMLVPQVTTELYDSHDVGYHWIGKVKSVKVSDDAKFGTLKATIEFDCYPFAIRDNDEFSDIWDDVYFPHWVFMKKQYTINGETKITITNIGSHSGEVTVKKVFGDITYKENGITDVELTDKELTIGVKRGENEFTFVGEGESGIELSFYREEMI